LLKTYVTSFDPSFVALRGSPEQTLATAKEFKVFFAKALTKDGTSYSMDHSAGSFVLDQQGRVRLYHRYGTGAKALGEDIKQLLQEGGRG
jgi:protein SCO1